MIPLFSLWKPLTTGTVIITIGLGIFGTGIWTGKKWNSIQYERYKAQVATEREAQAEERVAQQQALLRAIEEANARTVAVETAAAATIARLKKNVRTITMEVVREVEKPIYRCELPDTGRVFLNNAIREANTAIKSSGKVQ